MSELNEDILNYEIGDVDDTDLAGADEDELLLSDEESDTGKLVTNNEDDLLSEAQVADDDGPEKSSDLESTSINKSDDNASQSNQERQEIDLATVSSQDEVVNDACISSESDLVSSTNKEDEENLSQSTPSQSASEQPDEPSFCSIDKNSEAVASEENELSFSHSESTDTKSESNIDRVNIERSSDDYDADDSDDVRERRNPKTCVERELPQSFEENNKPKNFSQNFPRNRHIRGQMPRRGHPYGASGPEQFNPAFMQQFRGPRPRMGSVPPPEFMRGHTITMLRGPPNHMQRMPPGMQPHPSRMPPVGPHLGPHRMQRPPFQSPAMFGNNPMPPQGMHRPRAPPNHQMMSQRPPFGPFPQPNHPANMRIPMNSSMPPHPQPMNPTTSQPSLPMPIIGGPRKVLINPNFKGGVQAATNQLMMDTMKNSQILENNREAELLRQQEAFINQNRMHIEKRRRSREHSPERDREYRDRSYSPPRRRDRDNRKPYSNFKDNRNRRTDSRDREEFDAKRKRNDNDSNVDKNDPKQQKN